MQSNNAIPFIDLKSIHEPLKDSLISVFKNALQSGQFMGGPVLEQFETDFATYCQSNQCIGVSSGTDALKLALQAFGIQTGDSVITTPHTFIATASAIRETGARPEFIDINEKNYNIDVNHLKSFLKNQCYFKSPGNAIISKKTGNRIKAIVPVHLYGQITDMDPILEIAKKYHLIVVEDACQAHGAKYLSRSINQWKTAGSLGDAAAFSFYPGKNLGAFGEAGAVTTQDQEVANIIRMLRDHGQTKKYHHEIQGYNNRLDSIQAGILTTKLKYLDQWNAQRLENALIYDDLLSNIRSIKIPFTKPDQFQHVYHLYVIRTSQPDTLHKYLLSHSVQTGFHYPIPVHLQKSFKYLGYKKGDFPVTEKVASEIISLPMSPIPMRSHQKRIAKLINIFHQNN